MENNQSDKLSRNERIESYLREKYEFRFNVVKSRTEYRKDSRHRFQVVTKICLNSMRRELDRIGLNTSADNIRAILESDFAERVNPVQEYFKNLPRKEGITAIRQLAATITIKNYEHWLEYLTKWLVGVTANALNDDVCQNHVCLVLTGDQGRFKTT